jgi:hypothetical protein
LAWNAAALFWKFLKCLEVVDEVEKRHETTMT